MDNIYLKSELSARQLQILNGEFENKKKSKAVMYLLWFFFGGIGGHRYYLGNIGYAIGMTLTLGGIGLWTLIDLFIIGGALEKNNTRLEAEIIERVKLIKD